jgi:hypothetical protein
VEGEWLDGVPHGICIVEDKYDRGIMIFTHGKLNGGPSWFEIKDDGERKSFKNFYGTGPKGLVRVYNSDKATSNVKSTEDKQPTPGWLKTIVNAKDDQ